MTKLPMVSMFVRHITCGQMQLEPNVMQIGRLLDCYNALSPQPCVSLKLQKVYPVNFTEAIKIVLFKNYASFSGRASRSEYWWFYLFYIICIAFFGIIVTIPLLLSSGPMQTVLIYILGSIMIIVMLGLFLPFVGVQVRRFHDRDMSGWWYLLMIIATFIPIIGFISSIAVIVISAMAGTNGPNRFGPDPLSPGGSAEVFA